MCVCICAAQCAECNHCFFPGHKATTKSASDLLSEHALKKNSLSQDKSSKSSSALLQPQHNKGPNWVSKKVAPVLASEAEFELFAPDVIVRPTRVDGREEATNAVPLDCKVVAPKVSAPVVIGNEEEKAVTNCLTINKTRNGADAEEASRDNHSTTLRDVPSRHGQVASTSRSLQTSPTSRPASQAPSLAKVKNFCIILIIVYLESQRTHLVDWKENASPMRLR